MSVADYTSGIKEKCNSLASINVTINVVQVSLGGLPSTFGSFRTAVCMCWEFSEKVPSFFDLQLMLLVEENHTGVSISTHTHNNMWSWWTIGSVVMVDEAGRHSMEETEKSKIEGIIVMPTLVPDPLEAGVSRWHRKPARKAREGMLVLWQKGPQGERVLEEACRFGEHRIRIRTD